MIRLACSTVCLKDLPFEKALDAMARLGVHAVEVVALGGWSPDLAEWPAGRLRKALASRGLAAAALYSRPIDLHSAPKRAANDAYLRRAIDTAAELGCRRIVFPPLGPDIREGYDYAALAADCAALADAIGSRDMVIALENHHLWPLAIAGDYAKVFARVADPRVGMCADTGHFTASGEDLCGLVDAFGPRVLHVHLKDQVGSARVPFGEGVTPNAALLARLAQAGYDGYAVVESELGVPERAEADLARALDYCRAKLGLGVG